MPEFAGARVLPKGVAGGRPRIPAIQGVTDQVQRLAIPLWGVRKDRDFRYDSGGRRRLRYERLFTHVNPNLEVTSN
jgi:hypothetical protein